MHEPADFNYWKREAVAFQAGLLEGWPGPLRPVRCLGVDDSEPGVSWIWLELLAVLDSLPVTLAHHDGQASNFFTRDPAHPGDRTVAIDWGFIGLAPLGHDLGSHLWSNLCTWSVDPREAAALDRESTSAYLRGLRDFGWDGDEGTVLFARAAVGSLATATLLANQVSALCEQMPNYLGNGNWPGELVQRLELSMEDMVSRWAVSLDYALELGDEAYRRSQELR